MNKSTKMKQKTRKKFYYKGVKAREKWFKSNTHNNVPDYLCPYTKNSYEHYLWWRGFNGKMVSQKRERNITGIINRARALLTQKS